MKEVWKLRWWVKVVLCILVVLLALYLFITPFKAHTKAKTTQDKEIIKEEKKLAREQINDVLEDEPKTEKKHEEIYQEPVYNDTYTTRMTSFWANDGYGTGNCTGSGLCSWDFQVNDKGWYTYKGKLVVATATVYLENQGWFVSDGVHLYKYWEELVLTIDGIDYDAIVLDSCGSSMKNDRVDLFVVDGSSSKDTMIEVRRK